MQKAIAKMAFQNFGMVITQVPKIRNPYGF